MSLSKIQWTDRTWNPVRGCSRVSEGCRNCYAETMAARNMPGLLGLRCVQGAPNQFGEIHSAKGGDPLEWPEDLRVREFPA